MALERTYTIPLRKEWLKVAKYKRAKKAVKAVREFLKRHMKSDDVKLGAFLNTELWKCGIKSPPARIRVDVIKNDKGVVTAELHGKELPKPEAKKDLKKESKQAEKKIKEELKKLEEKTQKAKTPAKKAPSPAKNEVAPEEKTPAKQPEDTPKPKAGSEQGDLKAKGAN